MICKILSFLFFKTTVLYIYIHLKPCTKLRRVRLNRLKSTNKNTKIQNILPNLKID